MREKKTKILVLVLLFNLLFISSINVCSDELDPKTVYGTLYIDTNNDGTYEIAEAGIEITAEVEDYTKTVQTFQFDEINYMLGIEPGHTDQTCFFNVTLNQETYIPDQNSSIVLSKENENGGEPGYYNINLYVTIESEINNPPNKPILPTPENNSQNIKLNPELSIFVEDIDLDDMDITFKNADTNNIIGIETNVNSGSTAFTNWINLDYDTQYRWYVVSDDKNGGTNTSDIFTFKTKKEDINHPPYKPSDPTLENDSTNIELNPEISIYVEDPDDDNLKVDFFNASDDSIIGTLTNVESGTYATITWNDLSYNMTYSWYAKANDSEYSNTSDLFFFKTKEKQEIDNPPEINITFPKKGGLYYKDKIYFEDFLKTPIIIGNITIKANATDDKKIERVEFFISSINDMDGKNIGNATEEPYEINWEREGFRLIHLYSIKAVAYDNSGNTSFDEVPIVRKFF